MNRRFKLLVVTTSSCLVVLLLLGTAMGHSASPEDAYKHLAVYTDVLQHIKSDYVEEPDMKNVTVGALNGLLEALDPYASYLNADQYKQYQKQKDSGKANIGVALSKRFGYLNVADAIVGSPADRAGLTTGDVIEAINGVNTRDMPLAYAEILLQGDPGSSVELTVLRVRRGADPQKIGLVRAPIKLPGVTSKLLADGIGHIQVKSLETGRAKDVANAINELQKQGAKKLVLDLRDSSTGTPEEGIALANLFLDKGLITYLQGQKTARQNFEAQAAKALWKQPLAVITNRGTANGAEIAAAALLDSKRAEVIGERTYGDAAVRKAITMDDGGAVILSVAKYYSPGSGKAIQDTGVTPSIPLAEVEQAPDPDDDQAPPQPDTPPAPKSGEDNLLKKAIEVLKGGGTAVADGNAPAALQALRPAGTASRPDAAVAR